MIDHLEAAKGWLELDNPIEANRELDKIHSTLRIHPDVLEVRWQIHARRKWWIAALEISRAICELAPERPAGWLCQARSLHESGWTQKALELLREVAESFPQWPGISYNLARYSCLLDHADEAAQWLEKAMECGERDRITRMALEDQELKPIWNRVKIKIPKPDRASRRRKETSHGSGRRCSASAGSGSGFKLFGTEASSRIRLR
jgi:predicted Zn-dependent protease